MGMGYWNQDNREAPMKAPRETAKRVVVVVNEEWTGELDENFLGYTLQTNGVSVDGTHVCYLNNQRGSLQEPSLQLHRGSADVAATERIGKFLKCFRAVHPTGKYCCIYVYGESLR